MFTGLIQEIGTILSVKPIGGGKEITCSSAETDLVLGESIAVNGACQTVVGKGNGAFTVQAVEETVKKTTLGTMKTGDKVNLERALRAGDRIGGHFVAGHVDCRGRIANIKQLTTSRLISIHYPKQFQPLVIHAGSISVDGVSLTIAESEYEILRVAVIPHTWEHTTLKLLRGGAEVNLEFDLLGKYAQNITRHGGNDERHRGAGYL